MKKIRLYGILAKKFGREYEMEISSTREAMRALSSQIKGFEKFMLTAHERGLTFAVFCDDVNICEKQIDMQTNAKIIKIVPKVIGAGGKNGLLQTILGAVLVVVGIVVSGLTWGAATPVGTALIGAGVGLMAGGIAQMLMPKTQVEDNNQDGNRANKGFGGAVTTVAQGNPVPVLRGRYEIGGFIVSAGQYAEDVV